MSQAVEDVGLPLGGPGAGQDTEEIAGKSPRQLFWARFKTDKVALAGVGVIIMLVVLAVFAPWIAENISHRGPNDITLAREMTDDFGLPRGPNSTYIFGADKAGRDLFVRTIY